MKQSLLIIVGIAAFIIGAGVVLNSNNADEPLAQTQTEEVAYPANYIDYDPARIATDDGAKILYFHADWCINCRWLEEDIAEKGIPESVTIYKVNYDTNVALKEKYNVTFQTHTVLVDNDGNELASFNAGSDPSIDAVLENLGVAQL